MNDSIALAETYARRMFALGDVRAVHFFGGAALRLDGIMFAMVMRDVLYMKVASERREEMLAAGATPFIYRGRGQEISSAGYLSVPPPVLDDPDTLAAWAADAHREARVAPLARRKRRPQGT